MKNIDTEWEEYKAMVVPKSASARQIHDTHMAFLCGAVSLQNLILTHSNEDGERILTHLDSQINAASTANRILAMLKNTLKPDIE